MCEMFNPYAMQFVAVVLNCFIYDMKMGDALQPNVLNTFACLCCYSHYIWCVQFFAVILLLFSFFSFVGFCWLFFLFNITTFVWPTIYLAVPSWHRWFSVDENLLLFYLIRCLSFSLFFLRCSSLLLLLPIIYSLYSIISHVSSSFNGFDDPMPKSFV